MVDSLDELAEEHAAFVDKRNWGRFQTPQNLAMAVSIEANELLEEFLWFNNPSAAAVRSDAEVTAEIREEIADILIYTVALSDQLDVDLLSAATEKMADNRKRFDENTAAEVTHRLEQWQ
jgi:NTP pyrophosphatase (non-canonical NTP hydrolase)